MFPFLIDIGVVRDKIENLLEKRFEEEGDSAECHDYPKSGFLHRCVHHPCLGVAATRCHAAKL